MVCTLKQGALALDISTFVVTELPLVGVGTLLALAHEP